MRGRARFAGGASAARQDDRRRATKKSRSRSIDSRAHPLAHGQRRIRIEPAGTWWWAGIDRVRRLLHLRREWAGRARLFCSGRDVHERRTGAAGARPSARPSDHASFGARVRCAFAGQAERSVHLSRVWRLSASRRIHRESLRLLLVRKRARSRSSHRSLFHRRWFDRRATLFSRPRPGRLVVGRYVAFAFVAGASAVRFPRVPRREGQARSRRQTRGTAFEIRSAARPAFDPSRSIVRQWRARLRP